MIKYPGCAAPVFSHEGAKNRRLARIICRYVNWKARTFQHSKTTFV